MGMISRFNLQYLKSKGFKNFVETGAWYGEGIQYAVNYGYNVYSCELLDKYVMIVDDRFRYDQNVRLYHLPSDKFLKLVPQKKSVYWLDAHYPELYEHHENNNTYSETMRFPLKAELEKIKKFKSINESVIIIDDLRIYHELDYEQGNIDRVDFDLIKYCKNNFEHSLSISKSDTGYLILTPSGVDVDQMAYGLILD